jgi:hypothetical protein
MFALGDVQILRISMGGIQISQILTPYSSNAKLRLKQQNLLRMISGTNLKPLYG